MKKYYKRDLIYLIIFYTLEDLSCYHVDDEEWQEKLSELCSFIESRMNKDCPFNGDIVDEYVVVEVEEKE